MRGSEAGMQTRDGYVEQAMTNTHRLECGRGLVWSGECIVIIFISIIHQIYNEKTQEHLNKSE